MNTSYPSATNTSAYDSPSETSYSYSYSSVDSYESSSQAAREQAFLGAWLFSLLAALVPLAIGRFAIRLQIHGRIFEDDVAFLLAFVSTIAFAGVGKAYDGASVSAHEYGATSELEYNPVLNCLFFFGLCATRFSVLFLYRDLFWVSVTFRRYWNCMFVWLILATIVMMGKILLQAA